jgi:hypothetical protein
MRKIVCALLLLALPNAAAYATSCDTDCGAKAEFRYPCPTPLDPGRKCTGRNPEIFSLCETEKAGACEDLARQLIAAGRADATKGACIEDTLTALLPTSICVTCIVSSIMDPSGLSVFCSLASCYFAGSALARARDTCL